MPLHTSPFTLHCQWVWMDLDNTLWNFTANSWETLEEVYHVFGLERWFDSLDAWREIYERNNTALWQQYSAGDIDTHTLRRERFRRPFIDIGAHIDNLDAEADYLDDEYLRRLGQRRRLVHGALELVQHLRQGGYHTGILSNGFAGVQTAKLTSGGLMPYIDRIVLSEDINVPKPDRRIFDHAAQVAGVPSEQCVMIGDNPDTDIRGALEAGWQAVFYNPGMASVPPGAVNVRTLQQAAALFGVKSEE